MSRNKTIKLLHEVTLKSYAECRAALKRNHWDFVITYFAENIKHAMASVCEGLAHVFDGVAESLRHFNAATPKISRCAFGSNFSKSSSEILGLQPIDVKEDMFNYSDTVTASILNPSEVAASIFADYGESDGTTYAEMRDQNKPLSIGEIREQFGLEPIDVNDPKTPVFAPYYASKAKDGKLYQNDDKGI